MAIVNKDTLKSYFEFEDYPTEQQFANLIESLVGKLEGVSWEHLTPQLQSTISTFSNPNKHWQQGGSYVVKADNCLAIPADLVLINVGFTIQKDNDATQTLSDKTFVKKGILQVANDVLLKDCEAVIDGDLYLSGTLFLPNTIITGNGIIY